MLGNFHFSTQFLNLCIEQIQCTMENKENTTTTECSILKLIYNESD